MVVKVSHLKNDNCHNFNEIDIKRSDLNRSKTTFTLFLNLYVTIINHTFTFIKIMNIVTNTNRYV